MHSPFVVGFIILKLLFFQYMENTHVAMICKLFVEPYIVHAPKSRYAIVSQFVAAFLSAAMQRMFVAWDTVFESTSTMNM